MSQPARPSAHSAPARAAGLARVYVTRHGFAGRPDGEGAGDPRWKHEDPRLLPLGRSQAERLGRRLAKLEDEKPLLVSSPLWRTAETAQLIAEALDCTFIVDPGIMEFCHPKMIQVFAGLNPAGARAAFDRLANAELLECPWWPAQPETRETCRARTASALARGLPRWSASGARVVVLVGHGASADTAVECLAAPPVPDTGHDNCGLSLIHFSNGAPPGRLEYMNCLKHLA